MPTDIHRRINRERLRRELQLPSKLPRHFAGTYYGIPVYSDPGMREPHSRLKVIVRAGSSGSSRSHRVFVECGCSHLVPAGRYHQHVGSCDLAPKANEMAIYERVVELVGCGYSWEEINKWLRLSNSRELWEVRSGK